MADKYFVLQADKSLEPGQPFYYMLHLKDEGFHDIDKLPPTQASIKHGRLEWLIPNTIYNQAWISKHYAHFKILRQGQELTGLEDVKPLESMPVARDAKNTQGLPDPNYGQSETPVEDILAGAESVEPEVPVIGDFEPDELPEVPDGPGEPENMDLYSKYYLTPTAPLDKKQLKSDIKEKLTELGVEQVPKDSTLKSLQTILKQTVARISE